MFDAMYFMNPEKDCILAYGRVRGNKVQWRNSTNLEHDLISWGGPEGRPYYNRERPFYNILSYEQCIDDLLGYLGAVAVDCDLDAFELQQEGIELKLTSREKINKAECLVRQLPKPKIITIARSQTPELYVPSEIVDCLESEVIAALEQAYLPKHQEYLQHKP